MKRDLCICYITMLLAIGYAHRSGYLMPKPDRYFVYGATPGAIDDKLRHCSPSLPSKSFSAPPDITIEDPISGFQLFEFYIYWTLMLALVAFIQYGALQQARKFRGWYKMPMIYALTFTLICTLSTLPYILPPTPISLGGIFCGSLLTIIGILITCFTIKDDQGTQGFWDQLFRQQRYH